MKKTELFMTLIFIFYISMGTGCDKYPWNNNENDDNSSAKNIVLSVASHPDNTLMAITNATVSENASVIIKYVATGTDTYERTNGTLDTNHEITIIGMRAETTYTITATAIFDDGTELSSDPIQFVTGELPDGAPEITLKTTIDGNSGGITFFGFTGQHVSGEPFYWGVDEQGEVVWYYSNTQKDIAVPVMRNLEPGIFLAFFKDSIDSMTFDGETINSYDLSSGGTYHHDVRLLNNGNVIMLVTESEQINGETLAGDKIVELDSNGNIIWEWSAFDHLDTTRFPGDLSTTENRSGALDWTHSNSLFYMDDDDSILLSVRSQSWVVKIDHSSGDVVWILGDDSNSEETFKNSNNFFTLESGEWMTSQHAATVTSDGEILLYDNRNESDGESLMSRSVKYLLDETAGTAEQTWEGIATNYTNSMGDVDELSNGNILMCAAGGNSSSGLNISEFSPDASGEIVWSISINKNVYRAERVSWDNFLKIK